MTLTDYLLRRIAAQGPLSVADYMAECLLHPDLGYYTTQQPFGRDGDFTTAPEISQMFGELVGLSLAQAWIDAGAPDAFTLCELGGGRGTLMADALRAARAVPRFIDAMTVIMVEASPQRQADQETLLMDYAPIFRDTLTDLPDQPLLLIANEFFDCLPPRQFVRDGTGWAERVIGAVDGVLSWGLTPAQPRAELEHRLADTKDGDLVELHTLATAVTDEIARHIASHGGTALIVDYGDWRSQGDTLQALKGHAPIDPLAAPGLSDLTVQVDFEVIALAAQNVGARHSRVTPQGVWLERLGITDRARALAQKMQGAQLDAHIAAHRRLTHPDEMGNFFKVIAITALDAPLPAGFVE
jgi:NADH dehydrogenase [ubiquinone] 1 alpha subcomplex assembly factor 7